MGSPASGGVIPVYVGDPLNVTLTFQGMDLRGFTYVAQIRASASEGTVLTEFELSMAYSAPDSVISLSLPGDSPAGPDSITRRIGRNAVWDLQQYNLDGSASDTLVAGTLSTTQDVTR